MTIIVTLEGNALAAQIAQGIKERVYHQSSMVCGKESWTSAFNAIWYHQSTSSWKKENFLQFRNTFLTFKKL